MKTSTFLKLRPKKGGITYLLRDDFTDIRAAGAVNGTPATPGPGGNRNVTDGNSKLSIGGGVANFATGGVGTGNPGLWYSSQERVPGLLCAGKINASSGGIMVGFDTSAVGQIANCVRSNGTSLEVLSGNNLVGAVGSVTLGADYVFFVISRASGAAFWVYGGSQYPQPTLLWVGAAGTESVLLPGFGDRSGATVGGVDFIACMASAWLPPPLASDGFGSSFGTTDGAGHAEGVAGGIGSGGGGLTWTQQVGTWGTSGGKAVATSLTGGVAIATVPLSSANVFAGVAITRTANSVGPVVRYVDADNYVYAVHDGTNSKLVKRVAGTETVLVNVAATYSANASPIIDCNGTAFRLYYNNTLSGTSTISDSVLQSGTLAGILTKDTGNTLDNFVVMAKGTEGQYSNLVQYTV